MISLTFDHHCSGFSSAHPILSEYRSTGRFAMPATSPSGRIAMPIVEVVPISRPST